MAKSNIAFGLTLAAMYLVSAESAMAASQEARGKILCAAHHVVGCVETGECLQGRARDFDLPGFLLVDFERKQVTGRKVSGEDDVSPIRNTETTEKQLILQGVENHSGWTIAIDRSDYSMSLTISSRELNVMMFGECTAI